MYNVKFTSYACSLKEELGMGKNIKIYYLKMYSK